MIRNTLLVVLTACIILGITTSASAWDGQKKGFLLGIGGGLGLADISKLSYGFDGQIGYAPDDLLQVYLIGRQVWFEDNGTVSLNISGAGAVYSLKPQLPSLFLVGGLGFARESKPFEAVKDVFMAETPEDIVKGVEKAEGKTGIGLIVGGGYEFARHLSLEANLLLSSTKTVAVKVSLNLLGY